MRHIPLLPLVASIVSCQQGSSAPVTQPRVHQSIPTTVEAVPMTVEAGSTQAPQAEPTDGGDDASDAATNQVGLADLQALSSGGMGSLKVDAGFVFIEVGPQNAAIDPKLVKNATKTCGARALDEAKKQLVVSLRNIHSPESLVCTPQKCVHEAAGEYDDRIEFRFKRSIGETRLTAIVVVLDVPMRSGADSDPTWANRKADELLARSCR